MSSRDLMIYVAVFSLVWVGFYYGYRFLKLKNDLLGYEWFVLAISAGNVMLDKAGIFDFSVHVWHFLDTFSKLFGITVIGTIGIMKVTHGLQLSKAKEISIFIFSLVLSYAFETLDAWRALLPVASILAAVVFLLFCAYLAQQAFKYLLRLHGWAMIFIIVLNVFVAAIQDYVRLPDEETAIFFNKWVMETLTWSLSFAEIFYVYRALARAKGLLPLVSDNDQRQLIHQ